MHHVYTRVYHLLTTAYNRNKKPTPGVADRVAEPPLQETVVSDGVPEYCTVSSKLSVSSGPLVYM